MQKKWLFFGGAAVCLAVAAVSAAQLIGSAGNRGTSSVPEFILPTAEQSAEVPAQTTASASDETITQPEESYPAASSAESAAEIPQESTTAPGTSAQPQTTMQETASVPAETEPQSAATVPRTTRTSPAETENLPEEEPSTAEEQDPLPDNVMLTSGDPLHHIRFEFSRDSISFSGTYTGAKVYDVSLFRGGVTSHDLTWQGDSFTGTLDISGLKPGYNIIVATLDSAERMYYVFEVTEDGGSPVPRSEIPAESNLRAAESPLELPAEGVLAHITPSGDAAEARDILAQIKELSDRICAGITDDYSKARALSHWVSENMYYDRDASENGVSEESISLEAVLENHRSVCFGWSNLYAALCESQGIECFVASGSVVTGSRCFPQTVTSDERSHSWNLVRLPDRDIWVDTVWCSSNSYANGNYSQGGTDMQYFDITNDVLAHDHRVTRFEHRDYFGLYG